MTSRRYPAGGYPEDRPPTPAERRAFWDDRYAGDESVFGIEPSEFVASELAGREPCRVLDLGCGQGRNAVWLAAQGHDVIGVDLSPVAIEQAQAFANDAGVEVVFEAADLTEWTAPSDAFDLVVLSYLQLMPEQRRIIHARVRRVLRPGGTVFLIAHHLDNLVRGVGGPQLRDVLFTEKHLHEDFAGFTFERCGPVHRRVETESGQATAIDILMVAHKPL